jgi:hypothetical protein
MSNDERNEVVGPPERAVSQHAPLGPSPSVQNTMTQMTERMQTVIDAAERAAEAIRYDAEEQARRHLAETRRKADRLTAERVRMISELTDDLVRHADEVRGHSEQMVSSLEGAISSVTGKLNQSAITAPLVHADPSVVDYDGSPPLAEGPEGVQAFAGAEPSPALEHGDDGAPAALESPPALDPAPRANRPPVSQEALLHATRLAVAGNDRETITRARREEHGVGEPDAVVDRVLGTG